MSTPLFAQPERRSYLIPILLALAALAAAIVIARHYFPATSVDIEHLHTDLLPTTTVFKAQSQVVGINQTENTLFIASTVKIDNRLRIPIFLDGFDLTFTNLDGAQLTAKGLTKSQLADIEIAFPALKPLLTQPLLRDTTIDPGKSAQGAILYSLPIPKSMWDARKTATITVQLYHYYPLFLDIPKPATAK